MVKVNIISGFLGAGKTTLIKKLLSAIKPGTEKIILLENEYGDVGVDGAFMKDSGIIVDELNSGCICCTLVGDFQKAVDELIEKYNPDRLIIEPSGVGKLSEIVNAVEKCKASHPEMEISGCATLADDSGICANALGGAPGIYSARFAGEYNGQASDDANNALLLERLADKADKSAYYACFMALVYPDGREIVADGYMHGAIISEARGVGGFGYDPLFVPVGEERTVAEMSDGEKNKISHRAEALRHLLSKI